MKAQPWVVTGAAGFLGSHVVEQLLRSQVPVIGVDDLATGNPKSLAPFAKNPLFKFVAHDIRDAAGITEIFREDRPAQVIHLAAVHFIPTATRDPARAVSLNVHGTQTVLSAARDSEVRGFLFASTADVYKPRAAPHSESDEIDPINIYGLTKWMGEKLVQLEAGMHPERHFVTARLFNLYGPRETSPHILPEILQQLRNNHRGVLRLGNVTPKRDFVPVSDAARAVIEMAEKSKPGLTVANVGTGVSVSVQELVERIAEITSKPLRIETDPAKVRPLERPHLQADVGRLREMIGWLPHSNLSQGLRELLRDEGILL
jgi:UDP-glucose 4-epimerase